MAVQHEARETQKEDPREKPQDSKTRPALQVLHALGSHAKGAATVIQNDG